MMGFGHIWDCDRGGGDGTGTEAHNYVPLNLPLIAEQFLIMTFPHQALENEPSSIRYRRTVCRDGISSLSKERCQKIIMKGGSSPAGDSRYGVAS